MNKGMLLFVAAVALLVNDGRGSAQDPAPRRGEGVAGRYQLIAASDGHIYLLDTMTGQCWSKSPARDWRDEGNPTRAGIRKLDRPAKPSAPTLDLQDKTVEMTVVQREERAIPGSDGTVRVRLGDITEGQVHVSVLTDDGVYLLERKSVAQGDRVAFAVGKKKYTIHVKELRNILIGDDFAKITVAEADENGPPEGKRRPER